MRISNYLQVVWTLSINKWLNLYEEEKDCRYILSIVRVNVLTPLTYWISFKKIVIWWFFMRPWKVKTSKSVYRISLALSCMKEIMFEFEESLFITIEIIPWISSHITRRTYRCTINIKCSCDRTFRWHLHFCVPCDNWTKNKNCGRLHKSEFTY